MINLPILLKDTATRFCGLIDVSPTLLARDYKGFNNYGMAAVLEITRGGRPYE